MVGREAHDAIVVGGGHNGLVAAFYLARAGLRTLVLERRPFVGGACVTEELAPGWRASTGAYVLSMLRESIWRDMRLAERGLEVSDAGPSLYLYPDGASLLVHDDLDETRQEIARLSAHDADSLAGFEAELAHLSGLVTPLIDSPPPDPGARGARQLAGLAGFGLRGFRRRSDVLDALWLFSTSASQYLDTWFRSEHVKAALGWHAINDSVLGPASPGTASVLLHDHAAEQAGDAGGVRKWGFVRGGIGRVTQLMADAAREAGAEIRTDADVARVVVRGGRATGVALESGLELGARSVLSNADPKRTFLQLLDPAELPPRFVEDVRAYRCEGTSMKINLAVEELPEVASRPGDGVQPHHYGIMEIGGTLEDMDRAQADARAGIPALEPHIEVCFPTVHDPSLAPDGKHIVTIDVASQPYGLRESSWDAIKDEVADRAIAILARHMPGLPGSILHRQVLSPLDLERLFNMTGGHALHGDMSFDQLFALRPVRGFAAYRTPVPGLYLCGSGAHPGGGVTGAPGRNCAREVVRDHRRRRRTPATGGRR